MKLNIYFSTLETVRALILHIVKLLNDDSNHIFSIALSGGCTPALMFDLWANEYRDITPWERIRIYWVDERCVPPENSESNFGMLRLLLLSVVPLSDENVFRIHGEKNPEKEAIRYSKFVKKHLPHQKGWPVFDIILLGVGDDGHTSSIFPGQENLLTSDMIYAVSRHPIHGQKRIALTGIPIMSAKNVLFLVTGQNKASVVNDICYSGDTGPAAYIAHHATNVALFTDAISEPVF